MPQQEPEAQLVVFSAQGAEVTFSINGDKDTLWGTRQQIAEAFGCTDKNVLIHIQNIYEEQELDPAATSKKSLLVQIEGGRSVKRGMDLFNLDVILAVGYRISTAKATKFRQWATKTLRQLITTGFVLDESRLTNDATAQRELFKAIRALRHNEKAVPKGTRRVQDQFIGLRRPFSTGKEVFCDGPGQIPLCRYRKNGSGVDLGTGGFLQRKYGPPNVQGRTANDG